MRALHQSPNQRAPSGPICASTGRKFLSVLRRRSSGICLPSAPFSVDHDSLAGVAGALVADIEPRHAVHVDDARVGELALDVLREIGE